MLNCRSSHGLMKRSGQVCDESLSFEYGKFKSNRLYHYQKIRGRTKCGLRKLASRVEPSWRKLQATTGFLQSGPGLKSTVSFQVHPHLVPHGNKTGPPTAGILSHTVYTNLSLVRGIVIQ